MSLPNARVAPEEVLESYAEDTPEKVMALADREDDQRPETVDSAVFEGFVDETAGPETPDEPVEGHDGLSDLDVDELFR